MPINIKLPLEPNKEQASDTNQLPTRLINNITFFGDSAIPEDSPIFKQAWELARLLAQSGYGIVNGGGPGIMKAATDGAESINGKTIAVYWQPKMASIFEGKNLANITDESDTSSNYMIRTLGLIEYGDAYIIFKGGTGTISEFGMVWALAKLYYGCHKPVILFGDFWEELIQTIQKTMLIDQVELGVLYHASTGEKVIEILAEHEKKIAHCKNKNFSVEERPFMLGSSERTTMDTYNANANSYHSLHAGKLVSQTQLDEFCSLVNPPAQVLDIGTGPGFDAKYLSEKYTVTGIEISRKFAEIAQFENPNVKIVNENIVTAEIGQNIYKGIWARDSIHHIASDDLDLVFKKLYEALVQQGILYLIVREGQGEYTERIDRNYYKEEKFFHLFTQEELQQRAQDSGFETLHIDKIERTHKWLIGVFKKP